MQTLRRSLTQLRVTRARLPKQMGAALAFVAVAFLSFALLAGWRAWEEHRAELNQARIASANLARSLMQHTEDTLKLADTVLTGIVERAEAGKRSNQEFERLEALFRRYVADRPQFNGLILFDEKGHYRVSSHDSMPAESNQDRAYFQYHLNNPGKHAYVGPPIKSRSTGDWIVTVSKRIDDRNGRFAGVALATIKMDYFRAFHSDFDIGPRSVMFVAFENGVILTRRPFNEDVIGTRIKNTVVTPQNFTVRPVGSFSARSGIDGVERLYSYRYLDSYPLVAVIGLSRDDVLTKWQTAMLVYAVGLVGLGLLLGFMGWRLLHAIRMALHSEKNLIETHASLKRVNRTLEAMALQDGLTGLANRRQFDTVLATEYKRALRTGLPLSVMMLDIDYFKQFNDIYGHPEGDRCLKQVSETLSRAIARAGDLVARYGGEEFSILLPNTELGTAEMLAQRVCIAIENLGLPHSGSPLGKVTASVGVASLMPATGIAHQMTHQDDLVQAADRALYIAKRNGRNQVCATDRNVSDLFDAQEDTV